MTPIAKARDDFLSGEGRMLASTVTGAPTGKYLRNRIEAAFVAGYSAAEADVADKYWELIYAVESQHEHVATLRTDIAELETELSGLRHWNERVSMCREHVADIVDGPCVICSFHVSQESLRAGIAELKAERDAVWREREIAIAKCNQIEAKLAECQNNAFRYQECLASAKARGFNTVADLIEAYDKSRDALSDGTFSKSTMKRLAVEQPAAPGVVNDALWSLIATAYGNLNDMPISDEWARSWCSRIEPYFAALAQPKPDAGGEES